jgi:dipeptidyl aminopeptidase/acylaminoacyl peptidase
VYLLQAQWQNLTRARIAAETTLSNYSPIAFVDKVKAPLMIVAGM